MDHQLPLQGLLETPERRVRKSSSTVVQAVLASRWKLSQISDSNSNNICIMAICIIQSMMSGKVRLHQNLHPVIIADEVENVY